jgi:hypothetical protein
MSDGGSICLGLLVLYVVLSVGVLWRRAAPDEAYFFTAATVVSMLQMRGAVVRADIGHIALGMTPLVTTFLLLPWGWRGKAVSRYVWAGILLVLLAAWPLTSAFFFTSLRAWIDGQLSPSEVARRIEGPIGRGPEASLPKGNWSVARASRGPLVAFPYDNYIPLALGRPLAAPVLQSYAATTETLQWHYVHTLEALSESPQIIYGPEGTVTRPVDSVQYSARVPVLFEYVLRHFRPVADPILGGGHILLEKRPTPRDLCFRPLAFRHINRPPAIVKVKLQEAATCALARLNVRLTYPSRAALGRYDGVEVEFAFGTAIRHRSRLVPLTSGEPFHVYLQIGESPLTLDLFSDTGSLPHPSWDRVALLPSHSGLFGVAPGSAELLDLECVDFSPGP